MATFFFCFYLLCFVLCVWQGWKSEGWILLLWLAAVGHFMDRVMELIPRVFDAAAPAVKSAVQVWS